MKAKEAYSSLVYADFIRSSVAIVIFLSNGITELVAEKGKLVLR
jgi:hypothetical protein